MADRRRWVIIAQVAASAAFVALIAVVARPADLWHTIRRGSLPFVGFGLAFVPLIMILRIFRWHVIARTRKSDIRFRDAYDSYMGGLAVSVVTPWVGELARGAFAAPKDKAAFVGLTFLDKLIDVTMLYVFACAGLSIVAPGGYKVIAAAAIAVAPAAWVAARLLAGFSDRLSPKSRIADALRRAVLASRNVGARTLILAFAVAAVNVTVYYCQLYVIVYAFSPTVRPEAAGLFPLITLSRLVPSIGGLGVREFVAGAIFARVNYSVSSAAAVDASFVQFVLSNVVPAAFWLASGRLGGGIVARWRGAEGD